MDVLFYQELQGKEREPNKPRIFIDDIPIEWPDNVDTTSPVWVFEVGLTSLKVHWQPDPLRSDQRSDANNRRQIQVIF